MVSQRSRKLHTVISVLPILILALGLACGTSAPQTTVAPADAQPSAPAPAADAQPATPTALPQAVIAPAGGGGEGPQYAPSFAEFWKPHTEYYGQPVSGGTLRVNYEDPLEHANTWGAYTGAALRLRALTHNNLVTDDPYDPAGSFIPDLARGWTVHEDLTGVTFFLREGVKWHNGADFTCEDARFTYEIFLTGEGLTLPYMKARLDHIDLNGLECLDDYTLKFRFNDPSAVPLLEFGRAQALIFNKEWFQAGGEDAMFLDVSVGTGPFKWSAGQEIGAVDHQNFEKDPNFFLEGIPYVDELVLFGILDEGAQQAAMLAHQTDWHWVRNFGQYDAYVDHPQIMTVIRSTRSSENIWLNMRKPPFDNLKVRQAVTMGIDKAAGIAVTLDGHGSQGLGLMPPGSFWAVERADACAIPGWCQPDDMAAQRAEAINILKGENFDFNKTYTLTVESDGQRVGRATFIQEQLRLLGIKTDFDLVETVAYRKQSQTGAWGDILASTGGVSGVDDPFVGLNYYYGCATLYNFQTPGTDCDQEVEGLFQKLSETTDRAARKQIGDQIQLRVMSQYWTIPFLWEQEAVAFWPEVRGYVHYPVSNANGYRRYWHLWIDPAHQNDQGNRGQISGVPGGE